MVDPMDVEWFATCDPLRAEEAFRRLTPDIRKFLGRYLSNQAWSESDCEDVVQQVLAAVWSRREDFEYRGVAAWWSYLKRTTDRVIVELQKANRLILGSVEDLGEVPYEELPLVESILTHSRISQAADWLWLGRIEGPLEQKVLAAQLHYLHEVGWQEVAELVRVDVPIRRTQLDDWLSDAKVLRHMCYRELYWPNDALATHLIYGENAIQTPSSFGVLASLANAPGNHEAPGEWQWSEVRFLLWYYRNGLTMDQIARFSNCDLSRSQMEELLYRCQAKLPFKRIARRLRNALESFGDTSEVIMSRSFWQRIVFQYRYVDDLPIKQVLERTSSAAEEVDIEMSAAAVNMWTSGRRLVWQLTNSLQGEQVCR